MARSHAKFPKSVRPSPPLTAKVRILETTDLHMQILPYDYFADNATPNIGLIPLAGLIEAHRSDPTVTALLFDNGDFLQGNPLADHIASLNDPAQVHPMIGAMNMLSYDAVGLGNHKFNYGLPFLTGALKHAAFPVVCANVKQADGAEFLPPSTLITKQIICDDGQQRELKVGVIGLVTPLITIWDRSILDGAVYATDIVETAAKLAPRLRAQGADIIVALCHAGIAETQWQCGMENAAVPLSTVPDIDVLLAGHTHDQFPNVWAAGNGQVDPERGRLNGKPAVMAGFYGSHLGVITLDLAWDENRWMITKSTSHLEQPCEAPLSALQQQLMTLVTPAHKKTLRHIAQPVAKTEVPINSHFATTAPNLSLELLADAQTAALRRAAYGQDWAHLPILSAVAPFRARARGGPAHYIDISAGDLTLKDASAIYPFSNQIYAVRRNGAQIADWLEKVAAFFLTVNLGKTRQPLIGTDHPPYCFDVIYGLTYEFDISVPIKRLRNLCFQGEPVAADAEFVVATNSYRANGGGDFFVAAETDLLYRSTRSIREILIDSLRETATTHRAPREVWRFSPLGGTHAQFLSAPNAVPPKGAGIWATDTTEQGFGVFDIAL